MSNVPVHYSFYCDLGSLSGQPVAVPIPRNVGFTVKAVGLFAMQVDDQEQGKATVKETNKNYSVPNWIGFRRKLISSAAG
jgi:hypothetical protein